MSRVNSDERNNSGTGDEGAYVTLKVKDGYDFEVLFRVKRSTPLKRLLNAYCFQRSIWPNCVTFLFDGCLFGFEQTPDELEMEEGDCIRAFLHQTEEQRVHYDGLIAKDMARETKEISFLINKMLGILWRIVAKLIAADTSLNEEVTKLTKLRNDEEKYAVFLKIGRIVCKSIREDGSPLEELKKELTRLSEEVKEDLKEAVTGVLKAIEGDDDDGDLEEDEEGDDEEDDQGFVEIGRDVSELVEWAKKNQDFLRCKLSKL